MPWLGTHRAYSNNKVIFAWIEGWYNPDRISRGRGMRAPDEYQTAFHADAPEPQP